MDKTWTCEQKNLLAYLLLEKQIREMPLIMIFQRLYLMEEDVGYRIYVPDDQVKEVIDYYYLTRYDREEGIHPFLLEEIRQRFKVSYKGSNTLHKPWFWDFKLGRPKYMEGLPSIIERYYICTTEGRAILRRVHTVGSL